MVNIAQVKELRDKYPDNHIMMGTGNLTELTHADTTGITMTLMGIISELKINHILTTEVSNHCKSVVKENDIYNAAYGTIGLESAFGAVNKVMSKYKIDTFKVIDWLTVNPASIMNIDLEEISPKNKANLTIIDPKKEWIFNSNSIRSNSTNCIFDNQELYGKIIHTIIGSKIFSN